MKVEIRHNKDDFTFEIKQDGYPAFDICEGDLGYLVDVFINPTSIDPQLSLFETFRVTVHQRSLILERSSRGESQTLLKLSKSAASKWAERVTCAFGTIFNSYYRY